MEHLKQETTSGAQLNLDSLYQLCPQCFTESKDLKTGEVKHTVDFEKLRLLLGDNIAEGDERYDFTWVGKRAALQEAAKPIRKTLRPCPEESVDWDNTKNLYIEGDNLEVLKLLQNSYMGKVKMIYIDPPYNTGNDFVYQDDFHQTKKDYNLFSGDLNEEGDRLVKNTESNGRFHSDWCSMIFSRLMLSRGLLKEDGLIFISIDDCEQKNLKNICDEVFGESNFVGTILWKKKTNGNNMGFLPPVHDYILCYAKNINSITDLGYPITKDYLANTFSNPDNDPRGDWTTSDLSANHKGPYFPITNPKTGEVHYPPEGRYWVFNEKEVKLRIEDGRIIFGKSGNGKPVQKVFAANRKFSKIRAESWWDNKGMNADATDELTALFNKAKVFTHPKPSILIYNLAKIATEGDDIILDFFSGSASTAHAIMRLNSEDEGGRKYIMVQLPEKTPDDSEANIAGYNNICEIGKERIRRAGKKILEEQKAKQGDLFSGNLKLLDVGFRVFKCDDSNMKDVYYTPSEYSQELLLGLEDNIKEDRNDFDLLFGCMLDWGVTLDLPLRKEEIDGVTIHIVNDGDMVACFDHSISEIAIDKIASLLPMRVVLRDSCFKEAKEKMNFFEIFKQRTGWSEEEVRKNVRVI